MDTALLTGILPVTETIAREAGAYLLSEFGKVASAQIEEKSLNSLVSYVDQTAERLLVDRLSALLPEAVFLTEESTVSQGEGQYRWVIDPLDGTTNFLSGVPVFSVSIGLEYEGKGVLGVIYDPNREECFSAVDGQGAKLNGRPIAVSEHLNLASSLLATGFPYHDYGQLDSYLQAMGAFMGATRGLRRMGSAAIDLAYVAAGRYDAFWEYRLQPWDISAGLVIVREAGGRVGDFGGTPDAEDGHSVLASNGHIHAEMLGVLQKHFARTFWSRAIK